MDNKSGATQVETIVRINLRKDYIELLKKFCDDENLINLFQQCIIDNIREKEEFYSENKSYPEQRNLFDKLRADLETAKGVKIREALGGKK